MAQFPNLALKILDPGLLLTGGPVAGTSIAFRLPTPAPQAIWSTAKLGRYCLISSVVTAIFRALFIEKPNAARAELSRIRRGMFALCHKVHPWRVLLSGKPGAVQSAFDFFLEAYGPKYDKAAACLARDRDVLLTFYDFPAEHWKHVRTTNPIESTFATVRLRTYRTKSCLSRKTAMAMVFKLCQCAQRKWRKLDGSNHLAEIIRGVKFVDGERQDRAAA